MNFFENFMAAMKPKAFALAILASVILYSAFFFLYLDLPAIGSPTFRIDYFAATITRGDEAEDVQKALLYSRPGTAIFQSAQAMFAILFLERDGRYIPYLLQHLAIIICFFTTAKVVESIFRIKLPILTLVGAWLAYIATYSVIEGVYKLETIVGTLTTILGCTSLYLLVKWKETRKRIHLTSSILLYTAALFCKEDYILPPLLLLGWYILDAKLSKNDDSRDFWRVLAIMAAVIAAFFLFNKIITNTRSFMTPVADANSPYFMTANPIILFQSAIYYFFETGIGAKAITIAYMTASAVAILHRKYWKETVLIGLIVGGLMGPYLIMPNHKYTYYAQKWLAWEIITAVALIHVFLKDKRGIATTASAVICALIISPTLSGVISRSDKLYHYSTFFTNSFRTSQNIQDSLKRNRAVLNKHSTVGVTGIGPGQLTNTPWQGNGETAFFLSGDLGLSPNWVLYAKEFSDSYRASDDGRPIAVRDIKQLKESSEPIFVMFDKSGNGTLASNAEMKVLAERLISGIEPPKKWSSSPNLQLTAEPQIVSSCGAPQPVQVSWDVAQAGANGVQIWVGDESSKKLWVESKAKGSSMTGAWTKSGSKFWAIDPASGKTLATLTIGGPTCRHP